MNNLTPAKLIQILLVEDNPGDVRLLREGLREGKLKNQLHVVNDGEQAMGFLHQVPPYNVEALPDLILLDLNLPRKDGREVLAECKSDPTLRRIPIVVLTSSEAESDILASYDLGANCYISKPLDLEKFLEVIHSLEDFWLAVVKLPPH